MVAIVELGASVAAPEGRAWLLVERTLSGRCDITMRTDEHDHARYVYEKSLPSYEHAIARATLLANRLGVETIYVQAA